MADQKTLLQLLQNSHQGNDGDFEALYKATSSRLFANSLKLLGDRSQAEDVLQDAFVQIWHNAGEYHAERGDVLAWMTTIVRYRSMDRLRGKKKETTFDEALHLVPEVNNEYQLVLSSAGKLALAGCMEELSAEQRSSILMAFFEGLTHEELASRVSKPLGTIKAWVRRGIQSIKACLER